MSFKLGMRIPPKIGAQGMESVASWAKSVGLDVVDVPYYNEEVKEIFDRVGIEVGSIDGVGAVGMTKLLSEDEAKRREAVDAINKQIREDAIIGAKIGRASCRERGKKSGRGVGSEEKEAMK